MKIKHGVVVLPLIILTMLAAPSSHAAEQQASKKQTSKQPAKAKPAKDPAAKQETTHQHAQHAAGHGSAESADVDRITVEELKAKIEKNEPVIILDVRSEGSYESSDKKIKGSTRMLTDQIESRLKEIPQDRVVVTYCT